MARLFELINVPFQNSTRKIRRPAACILQPINFNRGNFLGLWKVILHPDGIAPRRPHKSAVGNVL